MRTTSLLMLTIFLFGCGDKVWVKDGATQKDFGRDKALCIEKSAGGPDTVSTAPTAASADPKKFTACMEDLGYKLEYDRPLNPRRFWRRD